MTASGFPVVACREESERPEDTGSRGVPLVFWGEGVLTFWPALEDPAFTAAWTAWADERTSASERWWS